MLSGLWTTISKNFYVVGAAILAVLAVVGRIEWLKKSRDKAREKGMILQAGINAEKIKKRVIKEEESKRFSRREKIKQEIEKKKRIDEEGSDEKFEGIDNLTDSNKY